MYRVVCQLDDVKDVMGMVVGGKIAMVDGGGKIVGAPTRSSRSPVHAESVAEHAAQLVGIGSNANSEMSRHQNVHPRVIVGHIHGVRRQQVHPRVVVGHIDGVRRSRV